MWNGVIANDHRFENFAYLCRGRGRRIMKVNFKDRIPKACLKANEYNANDSDEILSLVLPKMFFPFIYP